MKILLLDAKKFNNKDSFHTYFKNKLKLKEYIGNNLDAMYDVLSSLNSPLTLYIYNKDSIDKEYGLEVYETLKDVEKENENIRLVETKL